MLKHLLSCQPILSKIIDLHTVYALFFFLVDNNLWNIYSGQTADKSIVMCKYGFKTAGKSKELVRLALWP